MFMCEYLRGHMCFPCIYVSTDYVHLRVRPVSGPLLLSGRIAQAHDEQFRRADQFSQVFLYMDLSDGCNGVAIAFDQTLLQCFTGALTVDLA